MKIVTSKDVVVDDKNVDDKYAKYSIVPDDYDLVSNNAEDVTSVSNLLVLSQEFKKVDYKNFRNVLKSHAETVGFDNLGEFEKRLVAEHFACSTADQLKVYSVEELIGFGKEFHMNSVKCRDARFRKAKMEVYNRLAKSEVQEIVVDISARRLDINYIEFGIEGTDSGDIEGIYDYIQSQGTYAGVGLSSKAFSPKSVNMQELADRVLGILNGSIM